MAYTNIDDPSAYFQTTLYTGAGAGQTVTNGGNSDLKPDWLWIKRRNAGYAHFVVDSNRGLGSSNPPYLEADSTAAENSNQNWISGVGTDGFTIGINEQNLSNTSGTYVAWQWKANGGTTANNTTGSINSVVQANTDAGFSIITYTGNATNSTVGHGLGVQPSVIINKKRAATASWSVWHSALLGTQLLELNTAGAIATVAAIWNSTVPTSSVFSIGTDGQTNSNNTTYVTYAFAEKQGYSKFGKYVGNASADGPFVYTGFKPAWVMIKGADVADDWYIFDNKRAGYNPEVFRLRANTTGTETTGTNNTVDHLSNGFKLRFTGGSINGSGSTYIYMAFAENPFTTSTGIPTTAR